VRHRSFYLIPGVRHLGEKKALEDALWAAINALDGQSYVLIAQQYSCNGTIGT